MKRLAIVGASLLAAATLTTTVQAGDVKVYGKMNVSLNRMDEGDDAKNWELNSNASRLGVKGSQNLNLANGLKAIYKAEYQIAVDDGDAVFKQRNIYAGVQGGFGTLIAGNHDTPLKLAQGKIDQFNDLPVGDIKNVFAGEVRQKNMIMYSSPKLGGIAQFNGMVSQGEQTEAAAGDDAKDGIADHISASLTFGDKKLKKSMYYAAIAHDSDVKGSDVTRLVGQVKVGPAKLGAMYQMAEDEPTGDEEEKGFLLSASAKVAPSVTLKAQYAKNDFEVNGDDAGDVTQYALGADYKLSKKAKVYSYLADVEEEDADGNTADEQKTFAVGMEVKF